MRSSMPTHQQSARERLCAPESPLLSSRDSGAEVQREDERRDGSGHEQEGEGSSTAGGELQFPLQKAPGQAEKGWLPY